MPPAQQQQAAGSKRRPELADIFRAYGESYRQAHPLPRLEALFATPNWQALQRAAAALREVFLQRGRSDES